MCFLRTGSAPFLMIRRWPVLMRSAAPSHRAAHRGRIEKFRASRIALYQHNLETTRNDDKLRYLTRIELAALLRAPSSICAGHCRIFTRFIRMRGISFGSMTMSGRKKCLISQG